MHDKEGDLYVCQLLPFNKFHMYVNVHWYVKDIGFYAENLSQTAGCNSHFRQWNGDILACNSQMG